VGAEKERPPPRPDRGDGLENERLPDRLDNEFKVNAAPSQGASPSARNLADAPLISPIALAAGREILFEATMDMANWSASHALAAAEAAWRGDRETLGVHLREALNALKAARMTFDMIESEKAKAAGVVELAPP
jgi:hypothetical protein